MHFSLAVWPVSSTVCSHLATALSQVGWAQAAIAAVPVTVYVGLALVMVFVVVALVLTVVVVYPAVWSKRAYRRTAGQRVLDMILATLVRVLRIWRR